MHVYVFCFALIFYLAYFIYKRYWQRRLAFCACHAAPRRAAWPAPPPWWASATGSATYHSPLQLQRFIQLHWLSRDCVNLDSCVLSVALTVDAPPTLPRRISRAPVRAARATRRRGHARGRQGGDFRAHEALARGEGWPPCALYSWRMLIFCNEVVQNFSATFFFNVCLSTHSTKRHL